MKKYTNRSNRLEVVRGMPELRHWPGKEMDKADGCEFEIQKSEVVAWLKEQPEVMDWLFEIVKRRDLVEYDESAGIWRGRVASVEEANQLSGRVRYYGPLMDYEAVLLGAFGKDVEIGLTKPEWHERVGGRGKLPYETFVQRVRRLVNEGKVLMERSTPEQPREFPRRNYYRLAQAEVLVTAERAK